MATEEYIKAYTKTCSNQPSFVDGDKRPMFAPWLTPDHARNVAQITKEHMINKACEWLNSYLITKSFLMSEFRKAMEGTEV